MGSQIYNGFASHVDARAAAAARRRGESVPVTPTAAPTTWTSALNAFNRTVQGTSFIDKANQFVQAVRSGDQNEVGATGMGWIGNTVGTVGDLYACLFIYFISDAECACLGICACLHVFKCRGEISLAQNVTLDTSNLINCFFLSLLQGEGLQN